MLHRQLLDRLLIAAAVLAAWALAAPGLEAARADAAQATVISPGGTQQALSLDALAGGEDVVERTYSLRGSSGESTRVVTGFSLATLLEAAGADPYSFSYLEVLRPSGGAVLLSRDQALDEAVFPDGPPVVYATASGTAFLRPSSGSDDFNASDSFEAPQGVTIVLRKGSALRVRAEASTLKTRPGEAVEFTAVADGGGAGEQLIFDWHFDDGGSASGSSATHVFGRKGSYDVVVGVTTPSDDTGAFDVVTIQVGAPLAGPDRKGGGKRRDASAPDHGAATGAGGTASGIPAAGASEGSSPAPVPTESLPQPKPAKPAKPAPAGEQVSGELLSLTAPAESKPQAAQKPGARAGRPDSQDSGGFGLPGTALGLLLTGGLLGMGALTETRRLFG